jgi:biotin carboxylase
MKKRILMLGAGFMQGVAIRIAKERGWEVIAVDGNPQAACRDLADRFEPIDLKDKESLAEFALALKAEGGLDGVFTAATDFSAPVAWIACVCALPGHSYESAVNASDKLRMRECFKNARVPSPSFVGVDKASRLHLPDLMKDQAIDFPVVVKPVDNMGARGCRRVDSPEFLSAALDDAIRYSRNGYVIVEEYMQGPEFSLEALVFDGEIHMTGIADRHIFFPPYFIEMGHTIPSGFSADVTDGLVDVFCQGIRALGLSWGVAKGDIKLTPDGPMIGEIAGRLSGGYMSGWTFPYSSGIELTGAALDLATGARPENLAPVRNWTSAERAWISIPGRIASVSGYESARAVPFVRDVFPRAKAGDQVNFPLNNVEKCGNCLALAPDRNQAIQAAEQACRAIVLRLSPGNEATDAFLSAESRGQSDFPPDAFEIPSGIFPDENFSVFSVSFDPGILIPVPRDVFPFLDSVHDWQGRTLRQALSQACTLVPELGSQMNEIGKKELFLYWKALLRGGIQGIVYSYDNRVP